MAVHLVGAGPGDPELLTVRAARLLAETDVVVHDALVGTGVLELVAPHVELIDVGKQPGRAVPQELINTLLVELGRTRRDVVRLKGGDPYLFGRGGEEALALAEAGVEFDVVPGVSSALAAPAAAGVPVTHRGVAATVAIVTGHRRHGEVEPDWTALAALCRSGGTLVILMGVAQRGVIAEALMSNGLACGTPVAISHRATTGSAMDSRCRLDELGDHPVASPSVMVVGAVAGFDLRPTGAALTTDTARHRPY